MSGTSANSDIDSGMAPFYPAVDDAAIKREKAKARELRNSQWWKRKRSAGICHYCRDRFPVKELTMDHVIPLSRGGESRKSNLVPCCKSCNNQKKQMLPAEWDAYMETMRR